MTFEAYQKYFENILHDPNPSAPYDKEDYMSYVRLNWSRSKRWFKTATLSEETKVAIMAITRPQNWILITEPWCGDAAHSVPFIVMMAALNPLIQLDVELRDSPPNRIEHYLTNGGKSIPKLIMQDESGKDIGVWGPRPQDCQELYYQLKKEDVDFETAKIRLQEWYNENHGKDIQLELIALLQSK